LGNVVLRDLSQLYRPATDTAGPGDIKGAKIPL
jgi:hypothetical protein